MTENRFLRSVAEDSLEQFGIFCILSDELLVLGPGHADPLRIVP